MASKLAKDNEKFFDYAQAAYMGGDLTKGQKVLGALEAFMRSPKAIQVKKLEQIQASGVSTDFEILTKDAFNVTIEEDNFDLGYEAAFKQATLGKGQDAWELYNVANGITFQKVEEGQRIEMAKMVGTKITAYVDYYGAALGWTDKMIRFRKVAAMLDTASAFRNKFWSSKADNHYALLAAAAALTVLIYQGVAADGRTARDILSLNRAAFLLGNVNKDKGYGDAANAPFFLYANPNDEERIEGAFRVTSGQLVAAQENGVAITGRRIRRIYTYNSSIVTGSPIMVWGGNKIQKADAMQPTTFTGSKDILTLNESQAVWAIYGAIIGDTEQTIQLTLS